MNIIYKCSCMEHERMIQVPARLETTPIVIWIENLVLCCVAFDHCEFSPNCKAEAMEYMKVPGFVCDEYTRQDRKLN